MKNPARQFSLLFLLATMASGCATLNKEECIQANWSSIGYQDGSQGESKARLSEHVKACRKHGITPDATLYQRGYKNGIKIFCRADNGYQQGIDKEQYQGICPSSLQTAFLAQYIKGLKVALEGLDIKYDQVTSDLDYAKLKRARLKEGKSPKKIDQEIDYLQSNQTDILRERERLNRWIARWSGKL